MRGMRALGYVGERIASSAKSVSGKTCLLTQQERGIRQTPFEFHAGRNFRLPPSILPDNFIILARDALLSVRGINVFRVGGEA